MGVKKHQGTIVKIENNKMYIQFIKDAGCSSCEHRETCGMTEEHNLFDFELKKGFNVGDNVIVTIEDKTLYKSAFLIYIIPIILILLTAIISNTIFTKLKMNEILTPIITLLVTAIYFIVLRIKYKNKKIDMKVEKL
ncbi:SoxR reducing system RseC family protein [Deferribacter thermophilus]|uniref:SoxR reducing system RseC family protein n=1 Tax=Deferribacter thermophilus TaxID=53573 RepID=UPI003C15C4F5